MGGDIARTGDHRALAFHLIALVLQHVLQEIDRAIAGGLGADQAAAEFQTLAGQNAGEFIGDALVLAEHVADLARAHADVAGRHVDVGADMAIKLGHEGLAEAHHFVIRLALGIEVGAALAAAHGQAGQAVLEGLLEGQELQHAFGDGGMEADAALVGTDGVVVLHPPAALHADVVLVVFPADAEADDPVGLGDAAQDLVFVIGRLALDEVENVRGDFMHRLDEFGLAGIAALDAFDEGFQVYMF